MNNKIRIYDLARKLNKSNKELLEVLRQLDIPVKSHSSSIDEETAIIVENILTETADNPPSKKKQDVKQKTESIKPTEKPEKLNTSSNTETVKHSEKTAAKEKT
ncbi:MAG: translation initiation factor IF-2 N-terminal domain-containing protein, partial [Synergistaceae bacterium]|nr:translation initiation factor IF-2 N-terminal domain-containing protein [Synergistaceae bacterium]